MMRENIAIVEPRRVSFTAWWPLPLISSSCPGKIPNPVSSSGAPRKIDGMKFRKVWVIAIAVMKTSRIVIGRFDMMANDKRKMTTRFMWIPGIKPVKVPARMPRRRAAINSNIVYFVYYYLGLVFVDVLSPLKFYDVSFFEVYERCIEDD